MEKAGSALCNESMLILGGCVECIYVGVEVIIVNTVDIFLREIFSLFSLKMKIFLSVGKIVR